MREEDGLALLPLLLEARRPVGGHLEGRRREAADQLRRDGLGVAHERHLRRDRVADLFRQQLHVDDLHPTLVARRAPVVQDPVQPRPDQQDDVGALQGRGARGGDAERVVVRQHALAHGRGQKGQPRALHELRELRRRPRVGRALADDEQRRLGLRQACQRPLDLGVQSGHQGRICTHRRVVDFPFHLVAERVAGDLHVRRTWPAHDGVADGLLDEEGDAGAIRGLHCVLADGEGHLHLHLGAALRRQGLLEGAQAVLAEFAGACNAEHGPAVRGGVAHARERMHSPGPGDDQAAAGTAREVADCGRCVGGRLLIAHAHILDAQVLQCEAKLYDGVPDHPKDVLHAL
mmetsp:Transcript_106148/g.342380  ORF Transcript_106148/g.342380 Transcript_106148/m.342380 type:complete len:347 (+) Transcript_106148:791-1831(+)